jgi:hypothetical protein
MFASQAATLGSLKRVGRFGRLGDLVTMDSNQMFIPVLIPQTASPAVTGLNSNWLIAGGTILALLASWGLFGSRVARAKVNTRGPRKAKAVKAAKK